MALIVFETCGINVHEAIDGIVLKFSEIEGFDGISVAVPIEGESADKFHEKIGELLEGKRKPKVAVADVMDMHREVRKGGRQSPKPPA